MRARHRGAQLVNDQQRNALQADELVVHVAVAVRRRPAWQPIRWRCGTRPSAKKAGADPDGDGRIGPTSLDRRQRPRIAEQLIHAREILGQLAYLHRGASSNDGSTCSPTTDATTGTPQWPTRGQVVLLARTELDTSAEITAYFRVNS